MFGSLVSLLNLEQKHEMVTTISVEMLQTKPMYIGKWSEAIEAEMNIRHSETARSAIFSAINLSINVQKQILSAFRSGGCEEYKDDQGDQAFSMPKCGRLARMSKKSYEFCARCCQQFQREPKKS